MARSSTQRIRCTHPRNIDCNVHAYRYAGFDPSIWFVLDGHCLLYKPSSDTRSVIHFGVDFHMLWAASSVCHVKANASRMTQTQELPTLPLVHSLKSHPRLLPLPNLCRSLTTRPTRPIPTLNNGRPPKREFALTPPCPTSQSQTNS